MRRTPAPFTAAIAACVLLAGCGLAGGLPAEPAPATVIAEDGTMVEAVTWTYCSSSLIGGGCADGVPPPADQLPDVGDAPTVTVTHPEPVEVTAEAVPVGADECTAPLPVPAVVGPDGAVTLSPVGPAGDLRVDLFAVGEGFDIAASFRWRTSVDGSEPAPVADLAVLAEDGGGGVTSFGGELHLRLLGTAPGEATATVVVTDAGGRSVEVALDEQSPVEGCTVEGTVSLATPDDEVLAAITDLGTGPWRYDVRLLLDGRAHSATATFPDDTSEDTRPYVSLAFDPPLPGRGDPAADG